jgi:tetratricopeptide (TPR) repeat protein/ribosomal protein L40E
MVSIKVINTTFVTCVSSDIRIFKFLRSMESISTQEQFCENCGASNSPTARFCQYCAATLPFRYTTGALPEQTLLNGRYQLVARIGQGGMGAVYKALDTRFESRPVAIKEMSRAGLSVANIKEAEDAFEREAHLLASLLHPNLPRIYDNFTESERSYLVMDFIEGQTLEDYLEKKGGGPLPLEQVLDWGEQLCDVLSCLHNHQPPIIFRDLKPSNVMISESGHIYLIDFGIARIFKPGQSHDTVALGSPGYAAPEQYGKAQSTPRSDIYSLGALLHCLLTGVDPSEQPFFFRPASQINATVPPDLEAMLQEMLNMTADRRPASAQDVLKALRLIDQQRISGTLSQPLSGVFSGLLPGQSGIFSSPMSKTRQMLQDAYKLYNQRRVNDAFNVYNQIVQTDSTSAEAWQGRGLTQALSSRHQDALASFERALQINPNMVTALNGKGAALNMLHRSKEALAAFDRAAALEPNNALSWNGKGAALSALGQQEEALTAFNLALHCDHDMLLALNNKGLVLRQLKRYSEALKIYEQAIARKPTSAVYWSGKGSILYEMGRLREALQSYQEALKHNGRYAPALFGMGNVLYAQQKFNGALDNYNRALQYDPNYVKVWDQRGNVLVDLERYDEALNSYERALSIDPRYAAAWNGKANVLCHLERYDLALDAYERALRINNTAPLAWNGKGNAYYHLRDYSQALAAYERALQLNPKMTAAMHNKSLVFKHLGRYEEALDAAERSIHLAPRDPDNWLRKAEALKKLRRRREAREAEAQVSRLRAEVGP